jgi:hypothetical protein
MVTTVERQRLRQELVSQGYTWDYMDTWQPKTTLYRHAPGLGVEGKIVFPVGTAIKGVPGNPDYVARKSRLGMLPYPPTDSCECRWCVDRMGGPEIIEVAKEIAKEWDGDEESVLSSVTCQTCGFDAEARTHPGALSKLRVHMKTHEVEATT